METGWDRPDPMAPLPWDGDLATTADPTPPLKNQPSGTRQGAAGSINRFVGV
jgi:hypothetical protein